MAKRRYSAEQIVTLLCQIEVAMGQSESVQMACREAGISEQSFYRRRKQYGGLQVEQAKRMKNLEQENSRLKRKQIAPRECRNSNLMLVGSAAPGIFRITY
jgi:transposase-like protein